MQAAAQFIRELLKADPWDWRAVWLQGVSAIQAQAWHEAQTPFNTVYAQVPGELAPKFGRQIGRASCRERV